MNRTDEIDGEIRRLLTEVGDAAGVPPRFDELTSHSPSPDRGRPWARGAAAVAAAATAAAAVVGVVTLRSGPRETVDTAPAASAPSSAQSPTPTASSPTPSTAGIPGSTAPAPQVDPAQIWFLPNGLPAGYELTDISARIDPAGGEASAEVTWVRRGADGRTIKGSVNALSAPDGEPRIIDAPTATVHGEPAHVAAFSDDGTSWTVMWVEAGSYHAVQVTDSTPDGAVAIAEASIVTDGAVDLAPALVPLGYEAVPTTAVSAAQRNSVFLVAMPTDGGPGAIWADISTPGPSLDEVSIDEDERRVVDGVEVSITTRAADAAGPYTSARFVRDGWLYTVTGRTDVDTVVTFARSLQPVTAQRAAQEAGAITDRVLRLDQLGRASFADGTVVTARGVAGAGGALAVCIEAPILECHRPGTEATLGGVGEVALYELFAMPDGRRVIIGWQPAAWTATADDDSPVEAVDAAGHELLLVNIVGEAITPLTIDGDEAPTQVFVTLNRRP